MATAGTEKKTVASTNGKPRKPKQYRGGSEEFGQAHNIAVAVERVDGFKATLNEEQGAAFTALLKGLRDNVGWTKGGRILLKGNAERGN